MVDVCTYMGSPIAATKVEFVKAVDAIDTAQIDIADKTIATYNTWVSRVKVPGIAIAYPTTGSPDWYGRIETIDKTATGLVLGCRGIIAAGFDKFVDTTGLLWEGIVASTSSTGVTLDQALTASAYVGYGITFDDLTPPETTSDWVTASAYTLEYAKFLGGNTYSIVTLTASWVGVTITGTVSNTWAIDTSYLECAYAVSNVSPGFIMYGNYGKSYITALDFEFSLASLTYPSHLLQLKFIGHTASVDSTPLSGWPYFAAWNYTTSGWEGVGFGVPLYTDHTDLWPPTITPIKIEYWKNFIDRTNQKCRIRYYTPQYVDVYATDPSTLISLYFSAHIDYIGVTCIYDTVAKLIQMDPVSIVSHTESVVTLAINPTATPYNVVSGDGYTILETQSNMLNALMPDLLTTGAASGGIMSGYAYSVTVSGWTGRKDRLTPPAQIMADMCKEGGYHFWVNVDTNGFPMFIINSAWNTTASRALATSDINALYQPKLKLYKTKVDGVKVVGARHRYGTQTIDAQGSCGSTTGTNFKLYRAPHINTNNECDKIAANLYARYSEDQEVVTCTLTDSTTARQIQPGESVDLAEGITGKTFSAVPCISKHVVILPTDGVTVIECQFGEVPQD